MSFVEFEDVTKIYRNGEIEIPALAGVNFSIEEGEFCVIVGASGAGKTTILNILGGMDTLTEGHVRLEDEDISAYSAKKLTQYRRFDVGFVFQFYNLIPNLTALENVELAAQLAEDPLEPKEVLEDVGLKDRMKNFPSQLSGGEQQRVSIARALAKKPRIILGDEPTGALDSGTGIIVLEMLQKICREEGNTVIIVTHNADIAKCADMVIHMKNGKITSIQKNPAPMDVREVEW